MAKIQQLEKSEGEIWQSPPVAFRLTKAERDHLREYRRALPDMPGEAEVVRGFLRSARPYQVGETADVETKMGEATEKFVVRITAEDRAQIEALRRAEPSLPGVSELMRRIIMRALLTHQKRG